MQIIAGIHAMASVHERLYSGKALTKVELADYVRDLVRQIENMYQSEGPITLKLRLDAALEKHSSLGLVLVNTLGKTDTCPSGLLQP